MAVSLVATGITFPDASIQTTRAAQVPAFTNRIINGAMVIDQRNAGASVNSPSSATTVYTVDRWEVRGDTDGIFSIQQNSSAPDGFVNSLKITVTTIDSSLGAAQLYNLNQKIEGTNVFDLGFGTANAKTVTLSFWVRSSVTGTFGGALRNSGSTRSYPFTYTISVADTWEQKTVTIAGDTSGTWLTTTGIGISLVFSFGAGADRSGTAGAWVTANNASVTGATNLMATLNATWYITGVQLEKGSTATSFDYRPYGTELQLAQRYYEEQSYQGGNMMLTINQAYSTTATFGSFFYKVKKRIAPTISASGTTIAAVNATASTVGGTIGFAEISEDGTRVNMTGASGLVAGNASAVYFSYAKIKMDAEL
jgi:hypothetical protein